MIDWQTITSEHRAIIEQVFTRQMKAYYAVTGNSPMAVNRYRVMDGRLSYLNYECSHDYVEWLESRVVHLSAKLINAHDKLASYRRPFGDEQEEKLQSDDKLYRARIARFMKENPSSINKS